MIRQQTWQENVALQQREQEENYSGNRERTRDHEKCHEGAALWLLPDFEGGPLPDAIRNALQWKTLRQPDGRSSVLGLSDDWRGSSVRMVDVVDSTRKPGVHNR